MISENKRQEEEIKNKNYQLNKTRIMIPSSERKEIVQCERRLQDWERNVKSKECDSPKMVKWVIFWITETRIKDENDREEKVARSMI